MRFDRITSDPNILAGKATIRGMRISVAHVVNLVANGLTPAQILEELPDLQQEDIQASLAYAAHVAGDFVPSIAPIQTGEGLMDCVNQQDGRGLGLAQTKRRR